MVVTWGSPLCRLPSPRSRFVITVLPLTNAVAATHARLYEVIRWSFVILLNGVKAKILLTEVKALKGPEQSFNYRVYPVVKGSNNHVEVLIKAVVPKGGFEKSDVMAARRNGYGRNGYGINISFYNFVCFRAMLLIYD